MQYDEQSSCSKMKDFKFICSLVVWYDTLNQINLANKLFQEKNINITFVLESIEKLKEYLFEYRSDSNYQELLETAKSISEDSRKEFARRKEISGKKFAV